jgi:hypothetical protein
MQVFIGFFPKISKNFKTNKLPKFQILIWNKNSFHNEHYLKFSERKEMTDKLSIERILGI